MIKKSFVCAVNNCFLIQKIIDINPTSVKEKDKWGDYKLFTALRYNCADFGFFAYDSSALHIFLDYFLVIAWVKLVSLFVSFVLLIPFTPFKSFSFRMVMETYINSLLLYMLHIY